MAERLVDEHGNAYGVKHTSNEPHFLIAGNTSGASAIDTNLSMKTVSGSLGALNAELCLEAHDISMGTLVFQVAGTWSGKIVVEGAVDGTYNNLSIVQPGGTIAFTGVNNDNQNGVYRALIIGGYTHVRLRMSSYSTGSATVIINAAPLVSTPFVWQLTPENLNMQMQQIVTADSNNSSTTNLAVGNSYAFTGTATSTLGVAGIQVSLFTNKNARVFVEQSPEGTNWDLSDGFVYTASSNFGITVQAISSYVRVRVVTNSETTTVFRLQTALCPVVEAVPRTLDQQGNFKIAAPIDDTGFRQMISPYNEAVVSGRIRTVGAAFDTTLDANYWLNSVSTGTVGVTGSEGIVTSGTANGHYARLYSTRRSRFVSGQSNKCRMNVRLQDTGTANVKRRWGIAWGATMPTITDGAFFQIDGTTFSIVTLKGTIEAPIANGSFNGHLGSTYTPTFTNNIVYEILYTTGSIYFFVGDKLLHKVTASTASWTNTMSFHVWHDVVNSGDSAAVAMYLRSSSIYRIGELVTQPTSYYHASGQTAGVNLKVGPGNLHGIVFGGAANNAVVTLADSTTGATPAIWVYTATGALASPVSIDFEGIPFSTGLRLIVATGNAALTVIYE